jgi:septin family protein
MEDKVTVGKTINSWNNIDKLGKSILLVGPSYTGKTTFAELNKKYKYNDATPNLAYDNGKYNLEGVISNKSIKIQTVYPVVYQKSRSDDEELKLVDIPTFIYPPPETKKWTALEQKITT